MILDYNVPIDNQQVCIQRILGPPFYNFENENDIDLGTGPTIDPLLLKQGVI